MTSYERFLHLFLFEIIAVFMIISTLLYYSNIPFLPAFTALLVISAIAMIWNFIFNYFFDQYYIGPRETRSWSIRIFSMLIFEGGLILFSTPIIALVLQVSLIDAFVLDLVLTLFGMFYTLVFNYCYDHCRLRFIAPTQYSINSVGMNTEG